MTKKIFQFLVGFIVLFHINSWSNPTTSLSKNQWVDSVYQSLTLEEKIGQLFMVAAYSGGKNLNYSTIKPLVEQGKIGGVIYMQGNAEAQIIQTNELQSISKVPILIGMDAEWGLGMRLTGVRDYPKQTSLGATRNMEFVEEMGASVGNQLKRIGVHINFAPVVDVNNNPLNPIINFRSFGENKNLVTALGQAYMKGLEKEGITAVAKHFPGHGDVSVDSHYDLPVINKTIKELEDLELYPFKQLINKGLQAVMIAHLNVPAMDNRTKVPSTLSYPIVTEWLKEKLKFNGLIFTDALNMKGVTKYYSAGEVDLKAFLAGNDILLFSQNVNKGISMIQEAYEKGEISEQRLKSSVLKILALKYDKGLHQFQTIDNSQATVKANEQIDWFLARSSQLGTTLLTGNTISLNESNNKVLLISVNERSGSARGIKEGLNDLNINTTYLSLSNAADIQRLKNIKQSEFDHVIISIHASQNYPGRSKMYGIPASQLNAIKFMMSWDNAYLGVLANPYILQSICGFKNVIIGYENNLFAEKAFINVLFEQMEAKDTIPVSVCGY